MLDLLAAGLKAIGYVAALGGAGLVLARATLRLEADRAARLVRAAGIVAIIVAGASGWLFVERLGGWGDPAAVAAVFGSPLGAALGLQSGGGLVLALGSRRRIAVAGAILLFVSFGVVGHSATRGLTTAISVVVHVSAAGWWLGGLILLLGQLRMSSSETYARLVAQFSRQAIWIVALLIGAATVTAALLLEFQVDLDRTYDRGLLAKLGLTTALLGIAAINRLLLSPRLQTDCGARAWLRRTIVAELALFGGIFATTAWLTAFQSPHAAEHATAAVPQQGNGAIGIVDAWAPAMPGGLGTGAGYMVIMNHQQSDDRLIAVSSPWAEHVSLHESKMEGGMSRMKDVAALTIPAGGQVVLSPGKYHLMFTGLYAPFVAGDTVPLTLEFERAGRLEVTLSVRPLGGQSPHQH
jgi:copper(I)-binding protein/putative copper export protein